MKRILFLAILITMIANTTYAQLNKRIDNDLLLDPSELAEKINSKAKNILILSVGPGALIKNSVDLGEGHEPESMEKLRTYLAKQKTSNQIIIYCGCCPLDKCPNIRPALAQVQKLGFTDVKILNLASNIKVDWLDKKYPTQH